MEVCASTVCMCAHVHVPKLNLQKVHLAGQGLADRWGAALPAPDFGLAEGRDCPEHSNSQLAGSGCLVVVGLGNLGQRGAQDLAGAQPLIFDPSWGLTARRSFAGVHESLGPWNLEVEGENIS